MDTASTSGNAPPAPTCPARADEGAAAEPDGAPRSVDIAALRRMRAAKDLMDRSWSQPLDLNVVAARAGYSRYHFVRRFRAVYGETPGRYLTRRRIERAQELLRSANLTVTEICFVVGFTSLGTFCTRFKRQVGMTPTEFRAREHRSGPAPIPGCFALFWAGGFRPE
ncbi:helix-turn-helix transcriptional regulator [Actinoallomurus sp. NPDC052274]|uniref:helix-turn-helix transcriptional regulator n=1 Tax=Actinoallomurus sp. NPDC052274 TaxID=3155420 RepID=UPI00342B8088